MREDKKYEVLPGVDIPDIKKIQEAASDFSVSDVGEVELKTVTLQPVSKAITPAVQDFSELQELGVKVAEDEAKAQAESRAKMEKIMQNVKAPESIRDLKESHIAQVNAEKRKELEESLKEAEAQQAEEDAKNKAREERRQLQQRLLEESREKAAKERAEKEKAEKEQAEKELAEKKAAEEPAVQAPETQAEEAVPAQEAAPVEKVEETAAQVQEAPASQPEEAAAPVQEAAPEKKEEQPAPKPADSAPVVKKTAKMVSNDEAFDDFKEFLDGNN